MNKSFPFVVLAIVLLQFSGGKVVDIWHLLFNSKFESL